MKKTIPIKGNEEQLKAILTVISTLVDSEVPHEVVIRPVPKGKSKRTLTQNAALHKWFALLADELDKAGIDQKAIIDKFKNGFSLPVTESFIKDIFRECGLVMFHKKSTADLTTVELQKVWQAVDMSIAQKTGVSVEFPSDEPPIY